MISFAALSALVLGLAAWPWLSRAGTALADQGSHHDVSAAADARLLAWVLAWNAHAAWAQPLHWFDANIFHPARNMLAGSESLLGLLPLSLPVSALAGDAVLAANVTTWLSYLAAAVAMYAYLRHAGSTATASAAGAMLFCFGPYRLPADIRVLQLPCFFLPLLSLAVQTSREGRRVWLPVVALLALTSSLYMAAMCAAVLAVELAFTLRTRGLRQTAWLALSLLPIVPLLVAAQWPYVEQAATVPATLDPLFRADVVAAAVWGSFASGAVVWRTSFLVACAFGLVGLVAPRLRRVAPDTTWWRALVFVVIGVTIAAGPTFHVLGVDVPLPLRLFSGTPLAALRAFPRFLVLASFGVCTLAATGTDLVLAALRSRPSIRALTPATTLGLLLAATAPGALAMRASQLSDVDLDALAEVDRILAASEGAVLEIPPPLPGAHLERAYVQASFMLRSTRHWRPLVNGHTGYTPWWHPALIAEMRGLPEVESLAAVSELTAVQWIVVHRPLLSGRLWDTWRELPGSVPWLEVTFEGEDVLVLHVERERRTRWVDVLAAGAQPGGRTAVGTELQPLGREGAVATLEWRARPSRRVAPRAQVSGAVRVRNMGTVTWPALLRPEQPDDQLVVLEATWSTPDGTRSEPPVRLRLPRDVLPDDRVDVPFRIAAPDVPGPWQLTWSIRQVQGAAFEAPSLGVVVEVEAPS